MCLKKCRSVSYGVSQMTEGAIESIGPETCIFYSQWLTIVYTGFFPIIIGSISKLMQWDHESCIYTLLCAVFYMLLITHRLCNKTFLIAITIGVCVGLYTTMYIVINCTHVTHLFIVVCVTLLYIVAGFIVPYISFQSQIRNHHPVYHESCTITKQPTKLHPTEFHQIKPDLNAHSILDCF